ncbi:sensor histidine kinase [Corynebacterium mendelii]|uniref:histidine kinase n=2 Tax=Corynebacterium mendelii TaxID=2765362 RepID=A0A939E2D9_9CORY|nr:histidine kinase [Corynebacterium mendelii]MBN9645179.1 sensor histidine kinase [Corynebacterium mendelii]
MVWWKRENNRPAHRQRQLAELVESRRIIVRAFEIERRRIERDLHDGTQQHLVCALMKLGEAKLHLAEGGCDNSFLTDLLDGAYRDLSDGLACLRETVRGIHPHILTDRGLVPALEDMAERFGAECVVRCPQPLPELAEGVLAAGYFFTAEAVANAAKYAPGSPVSIVVTAGKDLRISVNDLGPGGVVVTDGHGLWGMKERLATFGGSLEIISPPGGPTQLTATIPLLLRPGESGLCFSPAPGS